MDLHELRRASPTRPFLCCSVTFVSPSFRAGLVNPPGRVVVVLIPYVDVIGVVRVLGRFYHTSWVRIEEVACTGN